MKVLYICADWGIPVMGFKGASVHVREFVNTLARLGHEVTLVFANHGEGNPAPSATLLEVAPEPSPAARAYEAEWLGLRGFESDQMLCRELDKLAYDRKFAARVLDELRRTGYRPDVVYERYSLFHEAGAMISEAFGVSYVVEMNAPLIQEHERHRGLRLRAAAEAAQKRCLGRADHIITVSEALKAYLATQGIPPHRVTCLPNGVDTRRFSPTANASAVRARHSLGDQRVLGFVGSLKPWHGLEFLFDAVGAIGSRRDDHRLLLVGDGPGFGYASERAEEERLKGRVVLAGKVPHDEIPAHLAAMDLTVAPYSAEDGFYFSPLKVLESLAAGRPVVAPRLGQLNDLIDDGITGLLYRPGDLDAFAASVELLLSDTERRRAMSKNARQFALANLSWQHVVERAVGIMSDARQAA